MPGPFILTPVTKIASLTFQELYGRRNTNLVYVRVIDTGTVSFRGGGARTLVRVSPKRRPMSVRLFNDRPSLVTRITGDVRRHPFSVLSVGVKYPIPGIMGGNRNSTLLGSPRLVRRVIHDISKTISGPMAIGIHVNFSRGAPISIIRVTGQIRSTNTTTVTIRKEAERRCCSNRTS